MNFRPLAAFVRKSWLRIGVLAIAGFGVAGGYVAAQTPQYQSTAQVYVSLQEGAARVGNLADGNSLNQQVAKSYADLATTRVVLNPVIKDLGLRETAAHLAGRIRAEVPSDSVLIAISARDPSSQRAADIANAVAQQLPQAVTALTPSSPRGDKVKLTQIQAAVPSTSPTGNALGTLVVGLLLGAAVGFVLVAARGGSGGNGGVSVTPTLRTT